jgi:hypothetical protein
MSFDSCLISLDLGQRLPVAQLRELSKKYTSVGVSPEAALRIVLNDQLDLARAQEKTITKAVRRAWEQSGAAPAPASAAVDPAPTAQPERVQQPGQLPDLNEMFTELLAEEAAAKPASDDLNGMFDELLAEVSGVDPRATVESIVNPKKPRRVKARNRFTTDAQEVQRTDAMHDIWRAANVKGKTAEQRKTLKRRAEEAEKTLKYLPPAGMLTMAAMKEVDSFLKLNGHPLSERMGLGPPQGIADFYTTERNNRFLHWQKSAVDAVKRGKARGESLDETYADYNRDGDAPLTREFFGILGNEANVDELRADPPAKGAKAKPAAAPAPAAREMTHLGRAVDGKPLKPGDVFKTSSGRTTSPFPKQAQQKYLSQWVIENAIAEAEARGDTFNAPVFNNVKPMRNGMLTQGDSDSMHEYLFGEQPAVVPKMLKPLAPAPAPKPTGPTPESHIRKYAKTPGAVDNGQVRKVLLDAGPMAADVAAILGEEGHLVTAVGKAMEEFGYKFTRFDGLRPIFERPAPKAEADASEAERTAGQAAASAAKNTVVGMAAAVAGLGELFGANIEGKMGVVPFDETKYQRAIPFFEAAVKSFQNAAVDIRDVMRALIKAVHEKFGYETTANMQPYIVRFTEEYRAGKHQGEENNAADATAGSASGDRENGPDGHTAAERDIFNVDARAAGAETRATDGEPDQAGAGQADRAGVHGRDAAVTRAEGDQRVRAPESGSDGRATESRDSDGSGRSGRDGATTDGGPEGRTADAARARADEGDAKLAQQRQAAGIRVKFGDRANIDETLPYLLEGQRDDVAFAEKRFAAADEGKMPGVLFTNGTGTGKTFTGLGILARQIRAGNTEGIIVVPNNQIAQDWIDSAERLGITIRMLGSTSENGEKGATITTFANFGANPTLADRDYDWVLADEAHYLMASKDGDNTDALATFRALTRHPKGFHTYARMRNRALYDQLGTITNKEGAQAKALFAQIRQIEEGQQAAYAAVASKPAKRPKAIFLSATPFAYVKSVDYAEGYLFEYPSDGKIGNSNQDGRAHFFVRHFGYRIRYHKLTEPDGNVDVGLMARQFNSWLKAEGALSGRMLEVEADYGRRFIQVESALGAKIDEGMEFMREHPEYKHLYQPFMKEFTYLRRRYLLEAIKAKEALPIIQQHVDMGRKVIVIHDYKKGGASNPFHMTGINGTTVAYDDDMKSTEIDLEQLAEKFKAERPDLVRLKFPATSALQTLLGTFPTALVHNGDVPGKQLEANKRLFNTDNNGRNIIILQSDKGREGISLHDTTGMHQRVEVIVGMAAKPTALIQLEGRAYRTGQVSDVSFDYVVTGTMWERWTFAQTIAERADIAEALAMGEQARALKDAIVEAFENAGPHAITENDGKGGKERDRQASKLITDWDRARTFYYGQLKRNSSSKSAEGKDYFATPEPLGLKMVEWADIRPGEDVLEPSAGHGAIARWFPILSNKTINEKETELITRARLAVDGQARFLQGRFEDVNIVNKFDAIVMNPPFGLGGSLAIPHLAKAYQHLRDGGRIVALLPRGPAADGKLEKFLYGDKAPKDLYMVADIELPRVTFGRAGTTTPTHIVILDKISDPSKAPHQVARDYTSAEDVEEFFERIQHSTVPGRVKTDQPIEIAIEEQKKAPKKQPREAAADATGAERYYAQFEFKHTKTGEQLYGAAMLNRTSMDTYKEAASIAKSHGGWYNKFVGGGALRGFLFRSNEERAAFMAEAGQLAEVSEGLANDEGAELLDLNDQRTIEVDGVRRPIRYNNGELVAPDFMAQMAFWREYDGELDERGRPVAPTEAMDIDRESRPWARAAQLEWERGTEHMIQSELPDGTYLLIYDANEGEGAELSRVDAEGNDYPGATRHADIDEAKAAAQLQYEQILAAGPLDISTLMSDGPLRAGDEPKRVATTAKLKKYRRQLEKGEITAEQMADRVAMLIDELDERNAAKAAPKERERGVEWVTERLMRARRLGEIDREGVDFALWALEQAPHLAEDLGISLRTGGLRTAGSYNPIARVMTLFKGAGNVGTATHEILHHSERMMPPELQGKIIKAWSNAWESAYNKAEGNEKLRAALLDMLEMAHSSEAVERVKKAFGEGTLDYDQHYQLANPSEYWAVNATRIMQQRFGANSWPAKAKRWMLELLEKAKGLLGLKSDAPILAGLRAVINGTGAQLSPRMLLEQAGMAGGPVHDMSRRQLPTPAWVAPADTRLDRMRHALQDKHIDMKRTVQAVRDAIGELGDKWNPYLQEELYHGRSATGFKEFLENELRPLLTDMQARGVTMEQLEEFLHMRHAEEANARLADINDGNPDGLAGVPTQEALDYLAALTPAQLAKFTALANRVDAIIKGTQRTLLSYGLEKQSTIDAWNATYQHYVPLMREDMDAGQLGNGTGAGYSVRGSASKARTGSKRTVVDILANVAMAREKAIVRGEKNRISMALYGLALQAPNPGFWKPVNPQKNPAALEAELVAMGLSPAEAAAVIAEPKKRRINPQTGMVESYVSLAVRNAPHVVAVRVNGEDRFLFFNERNRRAFRMAASIKNVGEDTLDGFMGMVAWATRQLAAMNTQYNPIFGAVNLVRDLGEGAINLSATPIAGKQATVMAEAGLLLAKVIKGRGRMSNLTGADAALWAEFQEEGGITGYRSMFSRSEDRMKELQTELSRMTANPARKAGRAVLDWLSDYNEALENVTRLSAYKVAKDNGMSNQQAASLAKNLTVNFNRKGAKTRILGALYAFFNAAVQGTTRMLETLTGPAGRKIIAGGLILGVLQSTMLHMAGFKDEDIPEFVRAKNLVIPASLIDGEKDYLTIPMPLGFSFIPSLGRIGTDFALDGMKHPGRYGSRILSVLLDSANPLDSSTVSQMISPTVSDPVVALAENKDFTGRDIAREDMNKLKPTPGHTRAKETASVAGKALSVMFNAATGGTDYSPGAFSPTPDQIDYFIGQLTGGVGRELMKAQQTASALLTGEEVSWNKVPLAGRFYSDANDKSAVATKFYENVKQLAVHDQEVEGRRRDKGDAKAYRAEHPEAKLADKSEAVLRDIAGLRERRRHWLAEGDKVRVAEFELKIRKRMKQFNDEVEAARSTAP